MKRNISILLSVFLFIVAIMPVTAYAGTYALSDTDMSISVDDTVWYVFTRDNIENNAELEELGITYEAMYDILHDNEAYLDAVLYYEDGGYIELLVRKRSLDAGIRNLSEYKTDDVLKLAQELAKKQGTDTYSVYEDQYKYAKLEYIDADLGYHICEFVTCVNGDNYTLTFQATSQYTQEEYAEIEDIVDSISFHVYPVIKEEKPSFFGNVLTRTISGALIGGLVGGGVALVSTRKKKRKESAEAPPVDTTGTDQQGSY